MKIVTIIGARPQIIKSSILRNIFNKNGINEILLHTGQHYDYEMSDIFFDELSIKKPEYFLELKNRSHASMISQIIKDSEEILISEKPDICILYGDTNSTLAGAITASSLGIPICHIESGLRSYKKNMPEETNRKLTDHLSDLLFCPTYLSMENLKKENLISNVYHSGDIMYDAMKIYSKKININHIKDKFSINDKKPVAVLTIHRESTIKSKKYLKDIIDFCCSFCNDYDVIFPMHPRTKNTIKKYNIGLNNIQIIDPQSYLNMHGLLSLSSLILTDSGGMQKEAYFHKKRCITLRDETEWQETINYGWNRLWKDKNYLCEPAIINDYGQGNAGEYIFKKLIQLI